MKKLLICFFFFTLLSACKKTVIVPVEEFNTLFGNWEWISSSGSFSGETISPATENYSLEIEYKKNGVYKKFKDGKKINKLTFVFDNQENILSGANEYLINYSKGIFSKVGVIPHLFEFIGTDTLILHDNCDDCYTSIYVRK